MEQDNLNEVQTVAENISIEQEQLQTTAQETIESQPKDFKYYAMKVLNFVWKIIKWILSFILKVIGGTMESVGEDMQHHKKR